MRRGSFAFVLAVVCLSSFVPSVHAQDTPDKTDVRPFSPHVGSSMESVSLTNGSLVMNIPLWSFHQRGKLKLDFWLSYDSPNYDFYYQCNYLGASGSNTASVPQPSPDMTPIANPCSTYPLCPNVQLVACFSYWELSQASVNTDPEPFYPNDGAVGVKINSSTDYAINPVISVLTSSNDNPYQQNVYYGYYYSLLTPDGGSHKLALTAFGDFRAVDGTGYQYTESNCTLRDSEGTVYTFQCHTGTSGQSGLQPTTLPAQLSSIEDTSGNKITIAPGFGGWTDTEGRTIPALNTIHVEQTTGSSPACPSGATSAFSWSIPGVLTPMIFCTASVGISTNINWPNVPPNQQQSGAQATEVTASYPMISGVVTPSGDTWAFSYTPGPGDSLYGTAYNYGNLSQITLPTGGTIGYTWSINHDTCGATSAASQTRSLRSAVMTRTEKSSSNATPAVWQYAYTAGLFEPTIPGPQANTVTDPLGNYSIHTLGWLGTCTFFETAVGRYDNQNNLLQTETTDFQVLPSLPNLPYVPASTNAVLPITKRTIWPDGTSKTTTYSYDQGYSIDDGTGNGTFTSMPYGNVVSENEYDFASGATNGTLLRSQTNAYWIDGTTQGPSNSPLTWNLIRAESQVTTTDAITGKSQVTKYGYDENSLATGNASASAPYDWDPAPPNGSVRGNQTSISQYLDTTGTYLRTNVVYTDTGLVHSIALPSNAPYPDTITTYDYSGAYQGDLLTTKTDTLGHQTTYTYNPVTDLPLSVTDPNNATTSYSYYPDTRLHQVFTPASNGEQGQTAYHYPSPTHIEKHVLQGSGTWVKSDSYYDGMGRISYTQLQNACSSGPSETDTTYDLDGRVYSTSNPYCPGQPSSTDGLTIHAYDGIDRPTSLTLPDSNQQTWSYNDESVTFTDETRTSSWTRTTDALGRLAQVVEPGGLITNYKYDAFGNLKWVNQVGNAAAGETPRTRSFTYDSLSRLITSQNPETGTICYGQWGNGCTGGYDAHGNLLYKTDANQMTTVYTYDALNRLLTKNAPDGSTNFNYLYDTCIAGYPCGNPIGRLVEESNPNISGTIFAYDPMGRITNTTWWRYEYPGWYGGMGINYDLAGNAVWMAYPDGRTITQNFDGAGRLTTVTDTTDNPALTGGGTPYFSNAQYTASGALVSASYGNGVTEYIQYNSRLQPCHTLANTPTLPGITYGGGGGTGGNIYDRVSSYAANPLTGNPCGTETGNNGNIGYIADFLNFDHTQSFTYDGLNRLTSAFRSDGGYNHTYKYDSFGNLIVQDNINPNPTYSINAANNQLNRMYGPINLYTYDAAGNLTSSGTSDIGGHAFAYNSSNQITAVDGGTTASYLYNGMGERTNKTTSLGWTAYIYLNGQPMSENAIISGTGTWMDYIYANGQKIARLTTSIYGGTSVANYYLDDHLGTTQVELDASGNVTWQGQFTPFGLELPDGSTVMHYKFTGKERDAESGLDFFGARYYGSAMGRWLSPDWAAKPEAVPYSKLDNPQSLNLYSYVENKPLSQVDPDGHCCEEDESEEVTEEEAFEKDLDRAARLGHAEEYNERQRRIDPKAPNLTPDEVDNAEAQGTEKLREMLHPKDDLLDKKTKEDIKRDIDRAQKGKAPIGEDGHPMELHHPNQDPDAPPEPMSRTDHRVGENYKNNHPNTGQKPSRIPRGQFRRQREQHWKDWAKRHKE